MNIICTDYNNWKIYSLKGDKDLVELGKNIVEDSYKEIKIFKNTKRNYVSLVEFNNKKYVLKNPRNEYRIPQRKLATILKKGEALTTLKNLTYLINRENLDEFVKPLGAIVRRKNNMIVESFLILEFQEGKGVETKEEIEEIVKFGKKLHKKGYYHGDFNTSNFIIYNKGIKTIDTQGKRISFGEYRKYYEVLTFSDDLLVLMYKLDGVKLFDYPKNIWYYLAYLVKYSKKNKIIGKIKKWKKRKRDKGWKI